MALASGKADEPDFVPGEDTAPALSQLEPAPASDRSWSVVRGTGPGTPQPEQRAEEFPDASAAEEIDSFAEASLRGKADAQEALMTSRQLASNALLNWQQENVAQALEMINEVIQKAGQEESASEVSQSSLADDSGTRHFSQ